MNPEEEQLFSKMPPHSIEAEQALLGCVLTDQNALSDCASLDKSAFYDNRHQMIFATLIEMSENGLPRDPVSVSQALHKKGELGGIGGLQYLNALLDTTHSAAALDYYRQIVEEKYTLRRMIQVCAENSMRAMDAGEQDVKEIVDRFESEALTISRDNKESDKTIKTFVHEAITDIQRMFESKGHPFGLTTGFSDLDKITRGLQPGVFVIAARPSVGKTSLAMNIVEHVALSLGLPVGVFSLEMSGKSLATRLIVAQSRISLSRVSNGDLIEGDFPKVALASNSIASSAIHIVDQCGISILGLKASARRMHQRHGIRLLVIDYLQLIEYVGNKTQSREQQVSHISRSIKQLSMELEIPVILLAQLNREIEKDKSRKPRLSDLRESGAIEQDADCVGLLYRRPTIEGEEDEDSDAIAVNLILAKHRNGPTGEVPLTFLRSQTRFYGLGKVEL